MGKGFIRNKEHDKERIELYSIPGVNEVVFKDEWIKNKDSRR